MRTLQYHPRRSADHVVQRLIGRRVSPVAVRLWMALILGLSTICPAFLPSTNAGTYEGAGDWWPEVADGAQEIPPPSAPASNQPKDEGGQTPTKTPPTESVATPDPTESDPSWLEVEGLGFRMRPPQPAFGRGEMLNGVFRYEVVDGEASPRWWLRFQNLTSSRGGLTAADQIKAYLDALTKNNKTYTIKLDEELTPQGATGEGRLVIIESPLPEGGTGLSGWAIVPIGTDRYLVSSIVAPAATFDSVFPQLRESFRTMRLISPDAIVAGRRERIERGSELLRFDEATLRSALQEEPLLFRVYRQGRNADGSDDTEIGWMTVRAIEGARGEVDGTRKKESFTTEEQDPGLLVIVQAKTIIDGDATNLVDTESRYWVAWNRQSEVWSIRSTQRQRDAARTSGQTGVRTPSRPGDPRPILRVVNSSGMIEPAEWMVPPNYLSQAELIMLGRLLPKSNASPPPFASYAFDPKTTSLPQRLDTLKKNDDGSWTLETKIGTSAAPLIQVFDERGNRVKRTDVDALGIVITERISADSLRALWRRKGLPIS